MHTTGMVSYVEEDGFEIQRGEKTIWVYGTAEAEYEYSYTPGRMYMPNGDPGYPEESDLERSRDLDCWVDNICDEDGNEMDTKLTDEEMELFEDHMAAKLDDEAQDHDFYDDYQDYLIGQAEAEWEAREEERMFEED